MRSLYFLLVLLFSSVTFAQSSHFVFDPTDNYENTVSNIFYTDHGVFMENLTGGELILGWERLEFDFPEEWEADLCDYVSCYVGIPESGTMLPISDTTRGFLKITLNPNGHVGTGTVSFKVFDNKHPEQADTLHFTIHTAIMSGLEAGQNENVFNVYPNPATDLVNLKINHNKTGTIQLLNATGQVVSRISVESGSIFNLTLIGLPKGLYVLSFTDDNAILQRQKLLIQ